MNHSIAQIVALTCHANAALRGMEFSDFFPSNSTCRFCDRVEFVESPGFLFGRRERQAAGTPDEWFHDLKKHDVAGVRLLCTPTWTMEAALSSGKAACWTARWEVWNRDAPHDRIWRVTYGRSRERRPRFLGEPDLSGVANRLLLSLRRIREFSDRHQCEGFTGCFDRGIASLTDSVRSGYHDDLAPADAIPPEAMDILDACQASWVFGGMGSWNDMGFDGQNQREYREVSALFYDVLCESISAAANLSIRSA